MGKGTEQARKAFAIAFAAVAGSSAAAQDAPACPDPAALSCTVGDRVVYLPAFFTQYNPVTALDMVARVPGFSIDPGDEVRGFGGAAGNVLIDGQRPSTKSADIFQLLARIGASNVERIELIRGGTGDLDVGGQAVVVNVVLKSGAESASPSLWEFVLLKRRPDGGVRPAGSVSIGGEFAGTKYTIGANAYGVALRFDGTEEITRFFGPEETRLRDGVFHEQGGGINLKLERPFANGDVLRFNVESQILTYREDFGETRLLATGGPDFAFFTFPFEEFEYEVGADYEHAFSDDFDIKLIGLFNRDTESFESGFEFSPAMGAGSRSLFLSDRTEGETIGRMEFGLKKWDGHAIQFGGEIASNFIDSEAELLVGAGAGAGALTPVTVEGANTRVSELRGEAFVSDSWKPSDKLTADLGFALELSRIAQSGDRANSRFFSYPKPSLTLTYARNPRTQWRVSAKREVAQLSFDEFVSAVNFDDEDIDFGNPELQPQRFWAFEAAYERRFGEIGVVELAGFYHYVQDVQDLLPIAGVVEVPGNIGDGRIYGGKLDLTAPLDWLALKNARIEANLTVRDSAVTDPVTGLQRSFSFTPDILYEVNFRQDLPAPKISWGGTVRNNDGIPRKQLGFGLDEVTIFANQPEVNVFIETTAFKGVKARFEVNDVINVTSTRARTVFQGSRALDVPLFRELRRSNNGGGLRLILSGSF